jgi:hypothetical protein
MATHHLQLLTDAIARNAGVVLSLPSAGMLRHHKSRFLAEVPGGFWVEASPREAPLFDSLILSQQPAGVSFKAGPLKALLPAVVLQREPAYPINALVEVGAVLLAMPAEVQVIQRRNNYRVQILPDDGLTVRIWRIAEQAYLGDRPMHAQEVACELHDLSLGGMGVTFRGNDGEPPRVATQDRLRIELSRGENKLLLEGRMRHPFTMPRKPAARAGVQFQGLEDDLGGRQILAQLTRMLGEFQREEVRRLRVSLSPTN